MIDFSKYKELKNSGAVQIQKIGTRAVVFVRSFNPSTGEENAPAMGPVNVTDVLRGLDAAQKTVDGINAFLEDVKALGVSVEPAKE